jgi:small subunit ribosomal protein S16
LAVRLRLRRIGKKKMPVYQIVAADSRAARDGKFLEILGRYEPRQFPSVITTREDRVFHWLKRGALPTDTVRSLLQRKGLWMKWSLTKKGSDEATIASAMEKWNMAQGERQKRDEARRARKRVERKKKTETAEVAAVEASVAQAPAQN